MLATAGFRPLWPVIFFLPWLILGIAYLLESVRRRRARAAAVVHGKVMSLLSVDKQRVRDPTSASVQAWVRPTVRAKRRMHHRAGKLVKPQGFVGIAGSALRVAVLGS